MRAIFSLCLALVVLVLPQAAVARDRDHDGLPDRWERQNRLSTAKNGANADPDRDRVDNRNELREGTKPRDRDTDNDGRNDGLEDRDRDRLTNAAEDLTGNDPRLRDTDGDGVVDGDEAAGVVTSFDGGVLIVELAVGGTFAGLVTADTELECESEDSLEADYVGPARRAGHRRGKRGRHGKRAHRSRAVASQLDDDEILDDDEGLDDEDWGDDLGEDEYLDEDEDLAEDEELGSCPAGALAPGARVSDAEGVLTGAGVELDYLALLR